MAKSPYSTSELNFTYYLGAGASAQVLPVINTMSSWFLSFAKELEENKEIEVRFNDIRNSYVNHLKEMAKESERFGTIDTYLKFLYLTDRDKFVEIKNVLSLFFLYYQKLTTNRDKRPLIFLTSVMIHNKIFPTNINMISWNYDFQIQLAAEYFSQESLSHYSTGSRHSPPLISYYPSPAPFPQDTAQLIHLNGIAGIYENNGGRTYNYFLQKKEDITQLMDLFSKEDNSNLISFAWEHQNQDGWMFEKKFEIASSIMLSTDILVVIGYSFPYFNRLVDDLMFRKFLEGGRQKKIYFQNPELDGNFLRNQFNIDSKIDIIHIKEKENYYIPKEL